MGITAHPAIMMIYTDLSWFCIKGNEIMLDANSMDLLPSSSKWVRENFVLGDILGSGTFGKVYTVQCRKNPSILYALKEISRATQPKYIATELKIMQRFGGVCNVMSMFAAHRERDRVFIVMEHFPHDQLKEMLGFLGLTEMVDYIKNLFMALDYLHSHGVIHRDVKPANFLYNRKLKKYALIDYGLSEFLPSKSPKRTSLLSTNLTTSSKSNFVTPNRKRPRTGSIDIEDGSSQKRPRVCVCFGRQSVCGQCKTRPKKVVNKAGTPGFRAPEVLLLFDEQTTAIDIWSAGVTMMSLLFRRHPVFRPADDYEAIAQAAQLIGSDVLVKVAQIHGVNLQCCPTYPGVDLVKLMRCVRPGLEELNSPEDRCDRCSQLFYDNSKGKCLCKSSESASMDSLRSAERAALTIVQHCLEPDPSKRYTAFMMLGICESHGF